MRIRGDFQDLITSQRYTPHESPHILTPSIFCFYIPSYISKERTSKVRQLIWPITPQKFRICNVYIFITIPICLRAKLGAFPGITVQSNNLNKTSTPALRLSLPIVHVPRKETFLQNLPVQKQEQKQETWQLLIEIIFPKLQGLAVHSEINNPRWLQLLHSLLSSLMEDRNGLRD